MRVLKIGIWVYPCSTRKVTCSKSKWTHRTRACPCYGICRNCCRLWCRSRTITAHGNKSRKPLLFANNKAPRERTRLACLRRRPQSQRTKEWCCPTTQKFWKISQDVPKVIKNEHLCLLMMKQQQEKFRVEIVGSVRRAPPLQGGVPFCSKRGCSY